MVQFSTLAITDLAEISRWIALDNPALAAQKSAMLADTCELLDSFPSMGAVYSDSVRYFTKEVWIILYRPTGSGVYIYRVFDSRQNWRSQLS